MRLGLERQFPERNVAGEKVVLTILNCRVGLGGEPTWIRDGPDEDVRVQQKLQSSPWLMNSPYSASFMARSQPSGNW